MNIEKVDISKSASASQIIFEALRNAIIAGEMEVGTPLRQDEIARMFNTSRIPVREAISRLEEHGLVKSQRYKGAVVSGLSVEEAKEIFQFRILLETEVIRLSVPRMTRKDVDNAATACEAFEKATDPMLWGPLNRDFHLSLYQASQLGYHLEAITNAMDKVDRYLRAQLMMSDGMALADKEHKAILKACSDNDAERAARLTSEHLRDAMGSLLTHLEAL
ncbi:GntR family transcriptional regulator [Polycladidibacter hongkongensis]|uniref:GntR family transcriptional regulator n=1 Tax=Polycladidibacter hongkongensis TaxID=1647556 RepID=UPI00082FBF86|nr:GntR family transcriptional regulator [Pseudovibrio hongkongensis]